MLLPPLPSSGVNGRGPFLAGSTPLPLLGGLALTSFHPWISNLLLSDFFFPLFSVLMCISLLHG